MTTNASPGATAAPAKEHPSHRGRDAREGAHNDDRTETANNPPNHGKATHGLARVVECIAERRCPECDGERARVINDTKFTETGLEYAPQSLVQATPDPGDADRVAALSSGDTGVTVEARIEDRETDMPDAIAEKAKAVDESGEIRLTVWDDADAPTLEEGECYRIENAMVDEYQGQVELYLNEYTGVERINAGTGNAPMDDSGANQNLDTATDGGEYAQLKPKIVQNAPRSSPFDAVEIANMIDADPDDVRDRLETMVSERGDMTGHEDGTYEFI